MKIEIVKLNELKPLSNNVRKHPEAQIKELMKSLNQFGQTRALVVDESNNILVGNGLYTAMTQLNYETCSVYRVTGLSEKDKKKLVLSDNKTFALGLDDYDEIQNYINEITANGDFEIAGFDEEILKEMTKTLEAVEEDVMNYGNVSIPTSAVNNHVPAPQVEPQRAERPATDVKPVVNVYEAPHESAPVETTRKIVCPCCGEVIYLD